MNLSVQLKHQLSIGYEDAVQRITSISVFLTFMDMGEIKLSNQIHCSLLPSYSGSEEHKGTCQVTET